MNTVELTKEYIALRSLKKEIDDRMKEIQAVVKPAIELGVEFRHGNNLLYLQDRKSVEYDFDFVYALGRKDLLSVNTGAIKKLPIAESIPHTQSVTKALAVKIV